MSLEVLRVEGEQKWGSIGCTCEARLSMKHDEKKRGDTSGARLSVTLDQGRTLWDMEAVRLRMTHMGRGVV